MRGLGLQDERFDDGLHRPEMGRTEGLGAGAETTGSSVGFIAPSSTQRTSGRIAFMHAALCHVGLPRSRCNSVVFERRSGLAAIRVEKSRAVDGHGIVEPSMPHGAIARLLLLHLCTRAVQTRQRRVLLGGSKRGLLKTLGMSTSGGSGGGYATLQQQLHALANSHLSITIPKNAMAESYGVGQILAFSGWHSDEAQDGAFVELTDPFFASLLAHAVPLDAAVIEAIRGSALALDIYFWLAHRLCRVRGASGTMVSWRNLREQFGQEYSCPKNFKRAFRHELLRVLAVYPEARVVGTIGGLRLYPSPPALHPFC